MPAELFDAPPALFFWREFMKKTCSCLAALIILLSLSACGGSSAQSTGTQSKTTLSCSLEIRCDTLIGNKKLVSSKKSIVPDDGQILKVKDAEFENGDSVFDVTQKYLKKNNIQIDYKKTAEDTVYIEGISNLYQFDAGDLSGWEFSVDGKFPSVGADAYKLKDGDVILWQYTCDMGQDIGDNYES